MADNVLGIDVAKGKFDVVLMRADVRQRVAPPPVPPKPPLIADTDLARRRDFSVFVAFDAEGRMAVMYWFAGGGGGEPVLAAALLAVSEHFDLLNTLVWDKVDPGLGWRWRRSWEAIIEASVGKPRL